MNRHIHLNSSIWWKAGVLAAVHSYFFPFIKMCLIWIAIHLKVLLHISTFPLELALELTAFSEPQPWPQPVRRVGYFFTKIIPV